MVAAALLLASAIGAALMAAAWLDRKTLGPLFLPAGLVSFYVFTGPLVILLARTLPHG